MLWRVCDRRRFLLAAMEELAGDAFISFEGDLKRSALLMLPGASESVTPTLKRNTLRPLQDFIVLPLEPELVKPLIVAVGGTVPRTILHIQIAKGQQLELGMYDNPNPISVFLGPRLAAEFTTRLCGEGILVKRLSDQAHH